MRANGVITLEESQGVENDLHVVEGVRFFECPEIPCSPNSHLR